MQDQNCINYEFVRVKSNWNDSSKFQKMSSLTHLFKLSYFVQHFLEHWLLEEACELQGSTSISRVQVTPQELCALLHQVGERVLFGGVADVTNKLEVGQVDLVCVDVLQHAGKRLRLDVQDVDLASCFREVAKEHRLENRRRHGKEDFVAVEDLHVWEVADDEVAV